MNRTAIAVCGKGGVGKTTISAIIAAEIQRRGGRKALVVDADPSGGLGMALGIEPVSTLNQIRVGTISEIKKRELDKQDLAREIDYALVHALTEKDRLAFLSVGRPQEVGCYCSVNSLLRDAIQSLSSRFDITLIDAEAGIEQVNRKVIRDLSYLVLVADGSAKALRVAESLCAVFEEINGDSRFGLILNRVESPAPADEIAGRTHLPILGVVPEDPAVRLYDYEARSFFDLPDCPARRAVVEAISRTGILSEVRATR